MLYEDLKLRAEWWFALTLEEMNEIESMIVDLKATQKHERIYGMWLDWDGNFIDFPLMTQNEEEIVSYFCLLIAEAIK